MPTIINSDQGSAPSKSRTPYTDHLRSGMNVVCVGPNRPPFWGEETSVVSGQFSGSVVPVAPVARGYMSQVYRNYRPAGEYRTEIPQQAGRFLPPQADEVGRHVVPERDYFRE